MLDDLPDFDAALEQHQDDLLPEGLRASRPCKVGDMYCAGCGESRKMEAELLLPERRRPSMFSGGYKVTDEPVLLCALRCVQCSAKFNALKYEGPDGAALVVVSNTQGGLSTPHTPDAVKYYLDQAYKSRAMGAKSAAIAMFRAALEHLLYEQGYQTGMLDAKVKNLEAAVAANTAPAWARDLHTDYLKVIKDLGNGAIHTNGGDVKKQAHIDSNLIEMVEATFSALLQVVYEIPHATAANLAHMKAKAALVK